ncbi:MAG: DUF1287 domain-containing protein [Bacteroidota bacterium]
MVFSYKRIVNFFVLRLFLIILCVFLFSCEGKVATQSITNPLAATSFRVADSVNWVYDASYYRIPYPNGDVPHGGVCTDVKPPTVMGY